jgi:hypothetical protein
VRVGVASSASAAVIIEAIAMKHIFIRGSAAKLVRGIINDPIAKLNPGYHEHQLEKSNGVFIYLKWRNCRQRSFQVPEHASYFRRCYFLFRKRNRK